MEDDKNIRIVELLNRLVWLMRSAEQSTGLNPVQWEALRYLARANRFSASPKAAADFLGSTKGTVSQTLMALEKKGLIAKEKISGDQRKVMLVLTKEGRKVLNDDPQEQLISDIQNSKIFHLETDLTNLLRTSLKRNDKKTFGYCRTCRHFAAENDAGNPHYCTLLSEPLSGEDSQRICYEHSD